MLEGIRRLRDAGLKTGMISNNDRAAFLRIAPGDVLTTHFDSLIFSSDVGVTKPRTEIFSHALDQLGVLPEESLFFDDIQRNIDGAKMLGIHGILATSDKMVLSTIYRILGHLRKA